MTKKTVSDKVHSRIPTRSRSTGFTKPKAINELLSKGRFLNRLACAASQQEQWLNWLASTLPDPLSRHVHASFVRDGALVVSVDAAAWSERLRQALVPRLAEICARDAAVKTVRVQVRPRVSGAPGGISGQRDPR